MMLRKKFVEQCKKVVQQKTLNSWAAEMMALLTMPRYVDDEINTQRLLVIVNDERYISKKLYLRLEKMLSKGAIVYQSEHTMLIKKHQIVTMYDKPNFQPSIMVEIAKFIKE